MLFPTFREKNLLEIDSDSLENFEKKHISERCPQNLHMLVHLSA